MYKASPRVPIADWAKASAAAVETVSAADFVSLSTSYAGMKGGFATITNAAMPDWQMYDRGRVVFTVPTLSAAPNDITGAKMELLAMDADENIYSLGTSDMDTDTSTFPPIEFDVTYEKYFVRIAELTSTGTPVFTVGAAVQGFYRSGLATS